MNEAKAQRHQTKRAAFEEVWVGPHGRRWYVPRGRLATSPTNNAEGAPESAVFDLAQLGIPGLVGERRLRPVRPPRADGSRGRPVEVEVESLRTRPAQRPPIDVEADALRLVERATADGEFIHRGRRVRVLVCPTGAVRTIPDKGAALRWADAATLAAAIACGAF